MGLGEERTGVLFSKQKKQKSISFLPVQTKKKTPHTNMIIGLASLEWSAKRIRMPRGCG
jgi:hypothetical protein